MADFRHSEANPLLILSAVGSGSEKTGSPATSALWQDVERHFLEHREQVYFYLLACGMPPGDADDLTQETFVRLFHHLGAGKSVNAIRPWLFRVARNLLLDRQRGGFRESLASSESDWLHWQDTLPDAADDPEREYLHQERHAELEKALQSLTPLQVQYLHLRADGLRHREIAEIYGVAVSSVVGVVRRAVERLGEEME